MNTGDEMNRKSVAFWHLFFLGLGLLTFSQSRADVNDYVCGSLQNAYGPYDYRSDKDKLQIVEQYHLTPEVINLVSGSSGAIGGDLGYTLRAFPNHHVALNAMIRLGEKGKTAKPLGSKYSVECWLQRAVRFRNDDAVVKMLYASYLSKAGKRGEALNQLDEAGQLGIDGANANYNMGLIYFDLKEYEKSLLYAQHAYILGYPLPGLRDKLKKVGKWREPPAGTASAAND
jgi:tetratricopeptide (TPR) repeat protein